MALPTRYDALIAAAAARRTAEGIPLDPRLVKAVIRVESPNFDPRAGNLETHVGDASLGLMQLLLATARQYRPGVTAEELLDPAINLELGTRHLAAQLRRAGGDWWRAVSAYNGGWRPELGFGTVLTTPKRICLSWKDGAPATGRSIDLYCERAFDAKAGQFGNQPYVDAVAAAVNQVAHEWKDGAAAAPAGPARALAAGILVAAIAWGLREALRNE
jgi:hypothetical protein